MARSFLGGEFAGGESAWWRGNWIPSKPAKGGPYPVADLDRGSKSAVTPGEILLQKVIFSCVRAFFFFLSISLSRRGEGTTPR